jgi:hypothetical protein
LRAVLQSVSHSPQQPLLDHAKQLHENHWTSAIKESDQ